MSQEVSVSHSLSSLGCGCCGFFLFDCLNVFTLCIIILVSATAEIEFPAIIVISGLKSCVVPIFGRTPEPGCGTMICKGPQHIRIHWRLEFSVEDWSGIWSLWKDSCCRLQFSSSHLVTCSCWDYLQRTCCPVRKGLFSFFGGRWCVMHMRK